MRCAITGSEGRLEKQSPVTNYLYLDTYKYVIVLSLINSHFKNTPQCEVCEIYGHINIYLVEKIM